MENLTREQLEYLLDEITFYIACGGVAAYFDEVLNMEIKWLKEEEDYSLINMSDKEGIEALKTVLGMIETHKEDIEE